MAWDVIEQKLESLRRALRRVEEKCPEDAIALAKNIDAQDILTLNLTRAIQLCVDIGAHLISQTELPSPETMGETFDTLSQLGVINTELAMRLKRAVGFRNIAVHNYEAINWNIVYSIAHLNLPDFEKFARAVVGWSDNKNEESKVEL
ncbi:MAG: DUF86 domain-containing protein [Nitrosomonas sp.]|nr:DUF86 domain-containing protein [Nitrosomonas sp.]